MGRKPDLYLRYSPCAFCRRVRGRVGKNTESQNRETALSNNYMTAPQQKNLITVCPSDSSLGRLPWCHNDLIVSHHRPLSDGSFALSPLMLVKRSSFLLLSAKVLQSVSHLQVTRVAGLPPLQRCVRDSGTISTPCLFMCQLSPPSLQP